MKYNTKLQRKKIYEKALEIWKEKRESGNEMGFLCDSIKDLSGVELVDIKNHFPEFMAQKPKPNPRETLTWWMAGTEVRIKALKAAIKLCDNG